MKTLKICIPHPKIKRKFRMKNTIILNSNKLLLELVRYYWQRQYLHNYWKTTQQCLAPFKP